MLRLHSYRYHRPGRVEEAVGLLAEHGEAAMPIAGGTDLMPNMKHKLFTPDHLVALRGIDELHGIEEAPDGSMRIGAAESLEAVASHPAARLRYPSLARACSDISAPQLRRMGTIGGNVCLDTRCIYYNQTRFWRKSLGFCLKKEGEDCHVVPGGTRCVAAHSADSPPVLMTLGASLEIAGPAGRRTVAVEEFFTSDGVWNRRMERDEIVVSVRLPAPPPGSRFSFQKLRARGSIDFPVLNLAIRAELDGGGTVRDLEMVASALASYPRRIGKVKEAAEGNRLTGDVVRAVAEQARRQCHPLPNISLDEEWRREMVPVLVRRGLEEIAAEGP